MHSARILRAASIAAALSAFIPLSSAGAITALQPTSLKYQFSVDGTLRETGSMSESSSPYWWLNSGGYMTLDDGKGFTAAGTVPTVNDWRGIYAASNPIDTDNGTHPQNLFRLVSRSSWTNVALEASYKIDADHFSSSPNRNASNGLLLMSRYQDDGQTLYYMGVRVDGTAVIKKKKNGTYTTLAQKQVFPGTYVEGGTVNLLPHGKWLSLKSETVTNSDGSVALRFYVKKPGETAFTKVLEAKDASDPISAGGYMGIRTDFMDVEFDDIKATKM